MVDLTYRRKITNKTLVFLTTAMSGIPLFMGSEFLSITYFLFLLFFALRRNLAISWNETMVIALFMAIEIVQHILHGPYSWRTSVGTLIKLSSAYLTIQIVSVDFVKIYIKQVVVISIISFIFYSLQFSPDIRSFLIETVASKLEIQPDVSNAFYERSPSIILYTFDPIAIEQGRNSGPFWEPGAFATFIVIALVFSILDSNNKSYKSNWILILALVSTLSTTGFLCLFVLFFGVKLVEGNTLSRLSLPVIFVAVMFFFNNTEFLREKIKHNIAVADQTTSSRFGSALADLRLLYDSPYVGWGRGPKRYGPLTVTSLEENNHRNNGLFILLATYGLAGSVLYLACVYRGFRVLTLARNNRLVILCLFILILLSFSQDVLFKPLFLNMVFLTAINTTKNSYKDETRDSHTVIQ